ncbi:DnaB-like helicase N-terminal domain-containing protein [Saccharopolyspora sp. NPDC049357]|uniref:DnaB-like helicase N-terminal domain-containing protein n=1 Tax=Saccharopolyspora sp. NPDC049357 TaxID=3154507 RepID=UPI0034192253
MNAREFAERALLGTLLQTPGHVRELSWLQAEDFRGQGYQVLYRTIGEVVREHDAAVAAQAVDARNHQAPHDVPSLNAVTMLQRLQRDRDPSVQRSSALTAPGLHQLLSTAPPERVAQPQAYAMIVLESSIRRQVQAAGMRVGAAAETSPDLAAMLSVVETALTEVDAVRQRWDDLHPAPGLTGDEHEIVPQARESVVFDEAIPNELLDTVAQRNAEYGLVSEALANPPVLDELADRVRPEDFGDEHLGNTYRAIISVHAEATATGVTVDAVTVAWQQQRQEPVHGPGLAIPELNELGQTIPLGANHARRCAVDVLRGSLSRLTETAAQSVAEAAQHPGLQPGDVLHTSTQALEAVVHMARRTAAPAASLAQQASPSRPASTKPPAPTQQVCNTVPLRPGRTAAARRDEIGR